jgi:two-component system sensor histidine kinase MprB
MTLRVKLIVALASIAAVATVLVGATSYLTTRSQLNDAVDESLRQAAVIVGPLRGGDRPVRADRLLDGIVVQRLDSSGDISSSPDSGALPVTDVDVALAAGPTRPGVGVFRTVEVDGRPYRMLTVSTIDGAVQVARSTAETAETLRGIRTRTTVLVALVVLAASLAGWVIGTQLTRRLRALSDAAGEVAVTGRLDVAMPTDGNDEAAQVGRSMRSMLDALAHSRAQQQQLIQDTGHELRTPLTSLRTNLQVLARFEQLDAPTRSAIVADLDSEARELSSLVEEVLVLAADRKVDEPVVTVALAPIAERVAERARRRSGRAISVHAADVHAPVRPAAIERAISNLVDNAAKFAPTGPIEITLAGGLAGDIDISVRDHGPGIDPTEAAQLFDRFHRSVSARSTPGSGLGLAIVAATAEQHGGVVHAANATGGGAVFGFTVRAALDNEATTS